MAEISNTTLAILVFATLIGVVTSTVLLTNQETGFGSVTGFAPTDTGQVNLTIEESLHIQVEAGNDSIDFGTCAPRAGSSYWCASNDTVACDGVAGGNCTGDTTAPQFIRVENIGNVHANVNITSSCNATGIIGGTGPLFQFATSHCENGSVLGAWADLSATTQLGCSNLSVGGSPFRMFVNITIPQDASQTACPGGVSTITFSGTSN